MIAGVAVVALVLVAGAFWFLVGSPLLQKSASRDSVIQVTPTPTGPVLSQYDRANRLLNKIITPDLDAIRDKHNQAGSACSTATGPCQAALEALEPLLAKAVADIDAGDAPPCIATQVQLVRTDLSNMHKSTTGAIAMLKKGWDDYGRQMVSSVGQIAGQLKVVDLPALMTALPGCPRV